MSTRTAPPRTIIVGDLHGEAALLDQIMGTLEPAPADEVVFLGDLIDRGPDSRGVLERVIAPRELVPRDLPARQPRDDAARRALGPALPLLALPGRTRGDRVVRCRRGRGVPPAHGRRPRAPARVPIEPFLEAVPAQHWRLIDAMSLWQRRSGFFLSHAGVEPDASAPEASRGRIFVEGHPAFPRDYRGAEPVVFGHVFSGQLRGDGKPLPFISARGNAIGLDTGSFHSGVLAAYIPEEDRFWLADRAGARAVERASVSLPHPD